MRANLIVCFFVLTAVAAPVAAAPSFFAKPRPYSAAAGGIQWEVFVVQNSATYTGSLSADLPLELLAHNGPAFAQFMNNAQGIDTNGAATATWYYNETASGSGTLLWNTTGVATNHTQNTGANPFCPAGPGCPAIGTNTSGLYIDSAGKKVFAALGSAANLPDAFPPYLLGGVPQDPQPGTQVRMLRVLTSDGILSWNQYSATIVENSVPYSPINGSADSIITGDMNANGNMNPTTGAFQDPTTFADIPDFQLILTNGPAGVAAYNAAHPGLNGAKRSDMNGNGSTNFADLPGFLAKLASATMGSGSGSGVGSGTVVPEPGSLALAFIGGMIGLAWPRRRLKWPAWGYSIQGVIQ